MTPALPPESARGGGGGEARQARARRWDRRGRRGCGGRRDRQGHGEGTGVAGEVAAHMRGRGEGTGTAAAGDSRRASLTHRRRFTESESEDETIVLDHQAEVGDAVGISCLRIMEMDYISGFCHKTHNHKFNSNKKVR
uniref:Uncharacterized protein n=1 Tax=Oryza rufipogon TaxID=4529 RepID=A0A0E0NFM8_ORYRU